MRTLFPILLCLLSACAPGDGKALDHNPDTSDPEVALEGCQLWSNWECDRSGDGCGATCGDASILCNAGDCRFDGGGACGDLTATGCDLCEQGVAECAGEWGL